MKVALNLTHRCNLACEYCYSGRKITKDMSFATARKTVDFAMDIAPPGQAIGFGFAGGEPLLCFDLLTEIVEYIRKQERNAKKTASLSITSNGTLLTEPILDFIRQENIDLCVSIDGPAHVHNLNRCYKDGRGSFEDVVRNIRLCVERLDALQVNAVYGPGTIDFLLESVLFLVQLGISAIHLNPDIQAFPEGYECSKLRESYMQVADHYIESYQAGREIAVNLIDSKIIAFLKNGYDAADRCGMGETEWGLAPSGNIYPCERLIGEDDDSSLCLGNVHTGLDLSRRCSILSKRGNRNEECKTCSYQKYCMNWCGCTNYHMTGHTDLAGHLMCESEKAAIQAAKHVLVTLSEQSNDLFLSHFLSRVQEVCYSRQR